MNTLKLFLNQYNSKCTKKSYELIITNMLNFVGKPIEDIKRIDLVEWKSELGNLSVATQANYIIAVKSYFKFLFDNEVIDNNPSDRLSVPKVINKPKDSITKEEALDLLKYATSRERAIIAIFLSTGIRVQELIDIKLDDYLNDNSKLILKTKGGKYRTVVLNKDCQEYINDYLKGRKSGCENLFVSNQHTPMTAQSLNNTWKRLSKIAGINKNITNHTFRSTFITDIAMTYNIEIARVAVCHSSITTTQRYVRGIEEEVNNIMSELSLS